ncbi:mon1 a-like protein, partial [Nannochloropsis gaditana CCMP526]|uniref:mon1 a-like protein n=1 Tax=Nannochloropsis gaditana (strain CCMP526) TaxID=1093141 RepID=UPI00029F6DCA
KEGLSGFPHFTGGPKLLRFLRRGDEEQIETVAWIHTGHEGVQEARVIEAREADGGPRFILRPEKGLGGKEIREQKEVGGAQTVPGRVPGLHQGDQPVARQKEGVEHRLESWSGSADINEGLRQVVAESGVQGEGVRGAGQ